MSTLLIPDLFAGNKIDIENVIRFERERMAVRDCRVKDRIIPQNTFVSHLFPVDFDDLDPHSLSVIVRSRSPFSRKSKN